MVSIRRRRYLGLCSGKNPFAVDIYSPIQKGDAAEHSKLGSVHPLPSDYQNLLKLERKLESPEPSTTSAMNTLKKDPDQYYPGKEVKRRKRHRRRLSEDQDRCVMRGVYFKNMKWQAAIKVDKKQIHLGTVGSQEEAALLYDRAAFMCGRQPNSELSEEEKKELKQYSWEEFLALTRRAINNKKNQRKISAGRQKKQLTQALDDWEQERETGSSSISEADGDVDA